ncbi:MAG: alternative ribosome rescue aminoacyl-tRNA hydrolase ArfB [Aureliella sp.]|jgi:ribosome-associated protein
MPALVIKEGLIIPEDQMSWTYVRSGGPGGQNVNKVSSKAVLRWQPPAEFLPPAAWARFLQSAKRYLTAEGEVVIASDEYRDQLRNAERSREKLRALLLTALVPPKRRIATRPTKGSKMRRLEDKRRSSEKKQSRRTFD